MANPAQPPEKLKPFAPPGPESLANDLDPASLEAKEQAEKIKRGKTPRPVAFAVAHDLVGPWARGQKVAVKDVADHFQGHEQTGEFIDRLVSLGALVPDFG